MNKDELIKELELLADSCDSEYALEINGYSQGVNDAIDLVKNLGIGDVSQQRKLLKAYAKYHNENFEYEKVYDTMIDEYLNSL